MSILEAYEKNGEPIITPEKFYHKSKKITDVAVVCFSYKAKDYVVEKYQHVIYQTFRATANGSIDIFYLPEFRVLFFMSPIGSNIASDLLWEVALIASVSKFVYFGSCGILDASLQNKYIIPTECYREDGYSYHYAPPSDYMTMKNASKIASFFQNKDVDYVIGKGWTTDSIYNETKKKFEIRKQEGVLCVDMEAAGLQAISNHIGVEVYVFFFSGDILGEQWTRGDLGGEREKTRQIGAVDLALQLGESLTKSSSEP